MNRYKRVVLCPTTMPEVEAMPVGEKCRTHDSVDQYMKQLEELEAYESVLGPQHKYCVKLRERLEAVWTAFSDEELEKMERRLEEWTGPVLTEST